MNDGAAGLSNSRRKRARAAGFSAFVLYWLIAEPILLLVKLILMSNVDGAGPTAKSPLDGLSHDGWWVLLIISVIVGLVVSSEIHSDLSPRPRFSVLPPAKVQWWASFWLPIVIGIAVYHVVWLFHEPIGLVM